MELKLEGFNTFMIQPNTVYDQRDNDNLRQAKMENMFCMNIKIVSLFRNVATMY